MPGHEHGPGVEVQAERLGALAGGRAEAVLAVDRLDPRDRGELAPGLARVGEEPEGPRADHGVVGDGLGRLEVALERRVLHELRVAGVGEPLAGDGVADEVVGDPQVEPGQVAERVGVLGARQPPDRDRPGVALVFLDESAEPRLDVPDGLLPLRAARLRLALRGHLPLAEHPDDLLPVLEARGRNPGASAIASRSTPPRARRPRGNPGSTPGAAAAAPHAGSSAPARKGNATASSPRTKPTLQPSLRLEMILTRQPPHGAETTGLGPP